MATSSTGTAATAGLLCWTELEWCAMSSAHVQELRGHYVRRLPTPEEIAARSPIVLTERDRQLLVAVHRHGFMTTDLVELAFFPPRNDPAPQHRRRSTNLCASCGCGATSSESNCPLLACWADVGRFCTRLANRVSRSSSSAWGPRRCPCSRAVSIDSTTSSSTMI